MRSLSCLILWVSISAPGRAGDAAIPIRVDNGRSEIVLATPQPWTQYIVVIGSLAPATQTVRIAVRAEASEGPEDVRQERSPVDAAWAARLVHGERLLARHGRVRAETMVDGAARPAKPRKTFHLFTGDKDLDDASQYGLVTAELIAAGNRGQVYLDCDDRTLPHAQDTAQEIIRVFDEQVHPWAEDHLGRAIDIDRDGRFTILLSRRLAKLQDGRTSVDGFVRGSDFLLELDAPFSNRCDMLYLNANLKVGPHLRTVLVHEYTHAVLFCERTRPDVRLPARRDEESWIHEGLAHVVERQHGFGWTNLDYRLAAYLSAPERYSLVVPDYYSAGVWRTPGTRGAAYLFFHRWHESRPELGRRLVQSPLYGIDNLEIAAATPFSDLFREGCVSLLDRTHVGFCATVSRKSSPVLLCGPRLHEAAVDDAGTAIDLSGSAAAFVLVHSPKGSHVRVRLHSEPAAPLQVTVVPRRTQCRLEASLETDGKLLRLCLTSHNADAVVRAAAWQELDRPERGGQLTEASGCLLKRNVKTYIALPSISDDKWAGVVRIWAETADGTPVTAWAVR